MTQPPAGHNRPSPSIIIAVVLILILGVVTTYSAFTVFQLPDPVTDQARAIEALYIPVLAVSFVVFFLVTAGLIWAIFRFRRIDPDEMPVQIHGSSKLEFIWTAIPILILVLLFIPAFFLVRDLKTPPSRDEADVVVEAIGHQWWWEFIYPDDNLRVQATPPNYNDLTPPALVVPVDKTIRIEVRSTDVIHSFYAINTLYKIQAIPGNVNIMHFTVEKPGVYYGQCYQFCGLRHSDMLFVLDAREQSDYDRWVRETRAAQNVNPPSSTQASTTNASGDKDQ